MSSSLIGRQAVVVGAGMAGLPAARALADYFEQVTVLERDALPADASPRIGTPQSRHTRALLGGGQRTLSELFPGFEQDLRGAGAVPYRAGLDVRFERPGFDPFPQRDLGWIGYAMSRPLIERTVRRHVGRHQKHHDTCTLPRPGTRALAQRHRGVGNPFREQRRTRSETLPADLAGEASGRGSLALASLGSIGQPPPEETVIEVDITYATAAFAIPEDAAADWRGVMTLDWPAQGGLGGIVKPLERNRWSVTLVGRHGDIPPTDREGFLAYAGRLRTPTIYDAIKNAEQLGEIARFGFPASVRRHFDRLKKFPRGLLPLGDALCRFNPVYGQGMSVAAQEAGLLHALLHKRPRNPTACRARSGFFRRSGAPDRHAVVIAGGPRTRSPRTQGQRPEDLQQRLDFGEGLNRLAAHDATVHKLMFEVLLSLSRKACSTTPNSWSVSRQ